MTAVSLNKLVFASVVLVAVFGLFLCAGRAQAQNAPAGSGQYKIAVVDFRKVMADYPKRQAEYARLEGEMKKLQTELDKMAAEIDSLKNTLEKGKDTMSESDRSTARNQLASKISDWEARRKTNQDTIDLEERNIIEAVTREVRAVIQEIGTAENYHLILDCSSPRSVLYFSAPMDITSKVLERLGKK